MSGSARGAELTERIDRTFDVKPGATVSLSNVNGSITIAAWDQPRVRVIAVKEVRADRNEVKDVLRELRVDLQPKDGGLVITTNYPRNHDGDSLFGWMFGDSVSREVTYELTVPRSMSLDLSNTNGSIRVADVSGIHEVETTNGKIELSRCSGAVDASTTNGSIRAELLSVTKGRTLRFHTTNGPIEVAVPKDFAANVDADTTNGAIHTDLPIATTHVSRNSLIGTINGGGTSLRMRTTNGGIAVRSLGKS
jgi:DUF4097 and DUF4098 domain-containing protein YvlB